MSLTLGGPETPATPTEEAPQAPKADERPPLPESPPETLEAALAVAQGLFPLIPKLHHARIEMKSGGTFEYDYADLGDIVEAVQPILAACGLSVSHGLGFTKNGVDFLRTKLLHVSGKKLKSRMRLTLNQQNPQSNGSLLTYYRRYAMCAILNIVSDKDDDGALAQAAYGDESPRSRSRRAPGASKSTRSTQNAARARTDPATDGQEGMATKDRSKLVSFFGHSDPPVLGGDAQALKVQALLELPESVPLTKLTVEQGAKLFDLLGIK